MAGRTCCCWRQPWRILPHLRQQHSLILKIWCVWAVGNRRTLFRFPPDWSTDLNTAIVDAGASGIFFKAGAPVCNVDKDAPKIRVGIATGDPHISSARCELARPELRGRVPVEGHVIPTFAHNLTEICQFCDADCTVQYTKKDVTIFDPGGVSLLRGWRDPGNKLWRMAIVSDEKQQSPPSNHGGDVVSLQAYSAYDLPSVEALVRFFMQLLDIQ